MAYKIDSVSAAFGTGQTTNALYADGGGWDSTPSSPTYLSDAGIWPANWTALTNQSTNPSGTNYGGVIDIDFTVTILSAGSLNVSGLILDHSGASFHYNANNGSLSQAISMVNPPPTATPQSVTTAENQSTVITLSGSDTDGDTVGTFKITSLPTNGVLFDGAHQITPADLASGSYTIAGTQVIYVPNTNTNGSDSFTFRANDGLSDSASSATVSLTVTPVDQPPVNLFNGVSRTTSPPARRSCPKARTGSSTRPAAGGRHHRRTPAATTSVRLSVGNGAQAGRHHQPVIHRRHRHRGDSLLAFTGTMTDINTALNGLLTRPTTMPEQRHGVTVAVGAPATPPRPTVTFSGGGGSGPPGRRSSPEALSPASPSPVAAAHLDADDFFRRRWRQRCLPPPLSATFSPLHGRPRQHRRGDPQHQHRQAQSHHSATAVNTVPGTLTLGSTSAITFSTANGNAISVSDPDAGTHSIVTTISVSDSGGTLAAVAGVPGVTYGGSGSSITLTGSQTAISTALNGLKYTPSASVGQPGNLSVTLTVSTNDQGWSSSGVQDLANPLTTTNTVTLSFPINDTPTITAPASATVAENKSLTFPGGVSSVSVTTAGTRRPLRADGHLERRRRLGRHHGRHRLRRRGDRRHHHQRR